MESEIDSSSISAYIVDGHVFLKQASRKIPSIIERTAVFDFDETLTQDATTPPYLMYFSKIFELNSQLNSNKKRFSEIFRSVGNKADASEEMETVDKILKNSSFSRRQHDEAADYVVRNAALVGGLSELQLDFRDMNIDSHICTGSVGDVVRGIVERKFFIQIPAEKIIASELLFDRNGLYKRGDWMLGTKKGEKIDEIYNRSKHLQILISDNPTSDIPMQFSNYNGNIDYGIAFNPAFWLSKVVELPLHVRTFIPEARKDIRIITKKIRSYDFGFLVTEMLDEYGYDSLRNNLKKLSEQSNLINRLTSRTLEIEIKRFQETCDKFLLELPQPFRYLVNQTQTLLGKLDYENEEIAQNRVNQITSFLEKNFV